MLLDRCPHCGSHNIELAYDGYSSYYVCITCSREYELNGSSRRMTPKELEEREGIRLTHGSDFL